MKTKIQIKSVSGKLLFEYETEENSIKKAFIRAISEGADMRDADMRGVNLTGTYLTGVDLIGAYLTGVNDEKIKIKKAAFFSGLYKYIVIPFIDEKNIKWVKMGCYTRQLEEWEKDFWNNPNEFLDHESEGSKLRLFAFRVARNWFEIIK